MRRRVTLGRYSKYWLPLGAKTETVFGLIQRYYGIHAEIQIAWKQKLYD
jgi:hypothetical protein